jgi:hypothetical protein
VVRVSALRAALEGDPAWTASIADLLEAVDPAGSVIELLD